MSANDNTATTLRIGPAWCAQEVVTFGGMLDTHIKSGDDYDTITLGEIFTMSPGSATKAEGRAFIPSDYRDYDAREHAKQREAGTFHALTGDIDSGNHALEYIGDLVRGFVGESAWLIYSSPHARPGDMRWRIIIPLAKGLAFNHWTDAQNAFFNYMDVSGVEMDRALDRAAQPVYLPNVPATHEKSGDALRGEDGEPLYYNRASSGVNAPALPLSGGPLAVYVAEIRRKREADERERQRIRQEAAERRAANPTREGGQIIEEFNRANSIETLFELYGYERSPKNPADWRSPHQQSDSYATRIFDDSWVSLSGSDTGARVGNSCKSGCFGDAYDLFVHYEHGGDHKSAFRAIYAERRAANPSYNSQPPVQADDPGWEAEPEGPDDFVEVAIAAAVEIAEPDDADIFELLDMDELEAMPPPSWLIHEMLVDDGLTVLYGDPGAGKSFIAIDMALRLAHGMEWHGRATTPTGILYIAGEGARGLGKRVKGWRRHHKMEGIEAPFLILPVAVELLDEKQRDKLLRTIDAAIKRAGFKIGLIVVDTISRALAGSDENGQEAMGQFVAACDAIKRHAGGALLGVHHSGKDKEKGMRGSTVLLGACDASIRVTKSDKVVTLKTEKQKDAEQADPIYMEMETVRWPCEVQEWQTTLVPTARQNAPVGELKETLSQAQIVAAFGAITDAWIAKRPLSMAGQSKRQGRFAPKILASVAGCSIPTMDDYLVSWLENQCLVEGVCDTHSKRRGLCVLAVPGMAE